MVTDASNKYQVGKMSVGQTLFDQMLRHHIETLQCAGSVLLVDALLLIELQLYGEPL
jgi:hypothetical protein